MPSDTLQYKANGMNLTERKTLRILRATHLGMCFGVRDAIALAKETAQAHPVTILGELVHNASVLADLKNAGLRVENEVAKVTTEKVMITAHGASEMQMDRIRQRGLEV